MVAQKKRNRHMLISFFVLLQYNNTTILYYILLACCLSQVCFQDMAAYYNTIYYLRIAYPKYVFRIWLRCPVCSLRTAFSLIWRTRSRVNPNSSPISSNVFSGTPMPKNLRKISSSRGVRVANARLISVESDSLISPRSALGESSFSMTSIKQLSSPSTKGASILT